MRNDAEWIEYSMMYDTSSIRDDYLVTPLIVGYVFSLFAFVLAATASCGNIWITLPFVGSTIFSLIYNLYFTLLNVLFYFHTKN